ncbi:MAG: phosphoribosyl-ATP diphosphatase [Deltaproteobacteria bacterium]|nr:phosphoribosyl-ATP diphosphatase [Deltaproteobacteria bacterium]
MSKPDSREIFDRLYEVILDRRDHPGENSYVSSLYKRGLDKILSKVGEEAAEVVIAGKGGNAEEVVRETADLFFHVLVLFGHYDISPSLVLEELTRRFGISGIEEKNSRPKP